MSMNVSTTTAAYANYQNNYKTGTANKKKETAQTTENTKLKENTTESIAEKNLSKAAQKMLENLRGSRNDMDFMVADFENGDNGFEFLFVRLAPIVFLTSVVGVVVTYKKR